jgi:hypothetical protein
LGAWKLGLLMLPLSMGCPARHPVPANLPHLVHQQFLMAATWVHPALLAAP